VSIPNLFRFSISTHLHCEVALGTLFAALVEAFQHGHDLIHWKAVHAELALLLEHGDGLVQVRALLGRPQSHIFRELHVYQGGGYLGFSDVCDQFLIDIFAGQDLKRERVNDP